VAGPLKLCNLVRTSRNCSPNEGDDERGATRADDDQGTLTQRDISSSILVYQDKTHGGL